MARVPDLIAEFLRGKRFAVAGVSREPMQAANAVYRKLRDSGFKVLPVNPRASEVEGTACYPDLRSIPGTLDGVLVATHPSVSVELVRLQRTWRRPGVVPPLLWSGQCLK